MKKIKCLDCDREFVAETPEDAMNQMHPHYMEAHQDVMARGTEESKKKWFEQFEKDWQAAVEI